MILTLDCKSVRKRNSIMTNLYGKSSDETVLQGNGEVKTARKMGKERNHQNWDLLVIGDMLETKPVNNPYSSKVYHKCNILWLKSGVQVCKNIGSTSSSVSRIGSCKSFLNRKPCSSILHCMQLKKS